MQFVKQQPSNEAPSGWFTGDVWWDVVHDGQEPTRIGVDLVRFSPGARTNWHSHVLGQTLHVVSGTALIGTRDGTFFETHPGETVTCPPGEEHWHGAAPRQVHGAPHPVESQGRRHHGNHLGRAGHRRAVQRPAHPRTAARNLLIPILTR